MLTPLFYYFIIFFSWILFMFISSNKIRQVSLFISFLILLWSFYMMLMFQYYNVVFSDSVLLYSFSLLNFVYQIQIDGISIYFILLSNLLLVLCLLINWT